MRFLASAHPMALSNHFNVFWMPDQVRHDGTATFYDSVKAFWLAKKSAVNLPDDNFQRLSRRLSILIIG
jgi:hypothetical protein